MKETKNKSVLLKQNQTLTKACERNPVVEHEADYVHFHLRSICIMEVVNQSLYIATSRLATPVPVRMLKRPYQFYTSI